MRTTGWAIVGIGLGLLFFSVNASAMDYTNWIPVLPQSIAGVEQDGEPEGMNMDSGGQAWSTLQQRYADSDREMTLSIIKGPAPQVQQFRQMPEFNTESQDQIARSLDLDGNKAMYQFDKQARAGTLIVALGDQTLVVLESEPVSGEQEMRSQMQDVPLQDIAGLEN
ncbi:hypothetical protein [Desulfovermiculus halophilus]|uniref:hypothetical protein n=1 Tax=Desulfovermiculus halophilus TaxID=339722 RepID=UPI0004848487|nr:hypothetical protein [Desulfovermiculus halophilus]